MSAEAATDRRLSSRWLAAAAVLAVAGMGLAACGKSSKSAVSSTSTTVASSSATTSASPGTMFSEASVSGLGNVVADGSGKTIYVLTSGSNKNVTCDDASGCTKVWPDLSLPDGTTSATAGMGIQQSLLSTMKLSDGETYPTYNGYLMYEFTGDSGPGQGHGEGINSFGGTWYALSTAGTPVTAASTSTPATTASSGNGGY